MLYSDGTLMFQHGNVVDSNKTFVNNWKINLRGYGDYYAIPWS
jgi:hypothetical protein